MDLQKILTVFILFISIPIFNWCHKTYSEITLDEYSKEIVQFIKDSKGDETFRRKLNELEQAELKRVANWMDMHIGEFIPIYFITMADNIYEYDKNKAMMWYFLGRIRAMQDVNMCIDLSARAQIGVYPIYARKTLKYANENKELAKKNIIKALVWDILNPKRTSPIWSCHHGVFESKNSPQIKPLSEYKKEQAEIRKLIFNSLKNEF